MSDNKTVDCRGLACPQPVIHTKDALLGATSPFLVIVDNEASCTNVSRFAESQGAQVSVAQQGGEFHLTIQPGHGPRTSEAPSVDCTCANTSAKNLVVYVSSAGMGRGDEDLGAILMTAFLDTLSHFKGELSHAIFVNAGAKLAVEGSPVLEQVRQLEQIGAEVLVCGTCLNHFGIKDKLAAGRVSNMYAIVETLSKAGRIIRP
jgi:selenium metabolism protein YedF